MCILISWLVWEKLDKAFCISVLGSQMQPWLSGIVLMPWYTKLKNCKFMMEEGWAHFEERKNMVKNQDKSTQCLLSCAQLSPAYFYPCHLTWTYNNFSCLFSIILKLKHFPECTNKQLISLHFCLYAVK